MPAEFLTRFFKKQPQEITYGDFSLFLKEGVEEHQNLEYKPRGLLVRRDDSVITPSNPKEITGFAALAKSVAGFANAEGGLLVLGVKEKEEKYKGQIVKIRPGKISPLPLTITREQIENRLGAIISYPVEGITIVPVRQSPRRKHFVYLVDVPQSIRAPHRVNQLYYYQRQNFSTVEMLHYQIADMFGRRHAPSLDLEVLPQERSPALPDRIRARIRIHNRGRAVAKYVCCLCAIEGPYQISASHPWLLSDSQRRAQFTAETHVVIYPEIPLELGTIEFVPSMPEPGTLRLTLLAEDMSAKYYQYRVIPYSSEPQS